MTAPTIRYLSYQDVLSYVQPRIAVLGRKPVFSPGPAANANQQKLSPEDIIFLNVGSGPGLSLESLFDRTFISAHVIGKQGDYTSGEQLAYMLDRVLLGFDVSGLLGSTYALYITRSGGPPSLLEQDTADRYHFTASYITEAETGL